MVKLKGIKEHDVVSQDEEPTNRQDFRKPEPRMRMLAVLLLLGAVFIVAYWLNYFFVGTVNVVPDYWYSAYQDSFPVADGWMALCMLLAGIGLWRGKWAGVLFGLMAGSALIFLATMDIAFNIEHGLYTLLSKSGAMVTEVWINASTLGFGIATLVICWRAAKVENQNSDY